MRLRAVLFDLDDTLILDESATRDAFAAAAHRATRFGAAEKKFLADSCRLADTLWRQSPHHAFCERIGINDAECLWGDFGVQTEELRSLGSWARHYRIEVFDRALREQFIENTEAAREISHHFGRVRRQATRLMPDALETLARLQTRYALGLLTNGAPDLQREKLHEAGLEAFFSEIVVSGEFPVGKPDARVFHELLARLEVAPAEAVMVGNSLARDVQGARAAGVCAIWFQVPGAEEPADITPDHTISSLASLPELLERIAPLS